MRLIPAGVLALGLLLGGAGAAIAQDADTGPGSPACAAALEAAAGFDVEASTQQGIAVEADARAAAQQAIADENSDATTAEGIAVRDEARAAVTVALAERDEARANATAALEARDAARVDAEGLCAEPEQPEGPQPGDECTDPVTGEPGTVQDDGDCVQDRDPFADCAEAEAALDAGTLLPGQFPILLVDGTVCVLPDDGGAPPVGGGETPGGEQPGETPAEDTVEGSETVDLGTLPAAGEPETVNGAFTSSGDELAYTGVSVGGLLAGGAALLAAGAGAMLIARRRGRHTA